MRKVALKILAVLLCGLLIYNSLGYFLVLSVTQIALRHQNWSRLSSVNKEELSKFVFDKNKSNPGLKIINSREIQVDGKLYDIARKIEKGETITYYCIYDQKEETLIAKTRLLNSKAQQLPFSKTTKLIIEKIIKTAIISEETSYIIDCHPTLFSDCIIRHFSGPNLQIALPPPQFYC